MTRRRYYVRIIATRIIAVLIAGAASIGAFNHDAAADQVRALARVGDFLPSGDGGQVQIVRFAGFTGGMTPAATESGHTYFSAEVTGAGVTVLNNKGIWRKNPDDSITLVARIGPGPWAETARQLHFTSFGIPMVHRDGSCVFMAGLGGSNVPSGTSKSFWMFDGAQRHLLVREGVDSAAGFSGTTYLSNITGTSWTKDVYDVGRLLFKSTLLGPDVSAANNQVIGEDSVGSSTPLVIARSGVPIQGLSEPLVPIDPQRITNSVGESIFYSTLTGPDIRPANIAGVLPNDQLIWRPGRSQPIARAGDPAPGAEPLRFYSNFTPLGINWPQFNAAQTTAFAATIADSAGVLRGQGYWRDFNGRLEAALRSGEAAPGLGAGITIATALPSSSTAIFRLAENSDLIVLAGLTGPGVNTANDKAIYRVRANGQKELIVRGGQQAPGAEPGVVIANDSIGRAWKVNAQGAVVFLAELRGAVTTSDDIAVFIEDGRGLRMIAREGQLLVGSSTLSVGSIYLTSPLFLNDLGHVIFVGNAGSPLGAPLAWFRVNGSGELSALGINGEIVPGQSGPTFRAGPMSPTAPLTFTHNGRVVSLNDVSGNADISGTVIIEWQIEESSPPPPCPADFNSDGAATVQDIFDFLSLWFAQDTAADFNNDQAVTVQDLFDFLDVWFGGCP